MVRWVHGEPLTEPDSVLAAEVVRLLQDFRAPRIPGGPLASRSHRLADLDASLSENAAAIADEFGPRLIEEAWAPSREAEPWDGVGVWLHGDIVPNDLVVRDGRLRGILDWGGVGTGDPAADVGIAWNFLGPTERAVLRDVLADDNATWLRARGWALHHALVQLPYYRTRYLPLAQHARYTIGQVLEDAGLG